MSVPVKVTHSTHKELKDNTKKQSSSPSAHDMFSAGVYRCSPEHFLSVDHPNTQRIRVERHEQNTDQFRISANFGNNQKLCIRYSLTVWCGDTEVHTITDEAIVDADSWFTLCVVDLNESLNSMGIYKCILKNIPERRGDG